jgi:hypothetical protein
MNTMNHSSDGVRMEISTEVVVRHKVRRLAERLGQGPPLPPLLGATSPLCHTFAPKALPTPRDGVVPTTTSPHVQCARPDRGAPLRRLPAVVAAAGRAVLPARLLTRLERALRRVTGALGSLVRGERMRAQRARPPARRPTIHSCIPELRVNLG